MRLVDQRSAEAEGLALKGVALKPDDTGLLGLLADAHVQQNRYREASELVKLREVIERRAARK